MSKKDLKKNNVNTAANELSEDALGGVAGGLELATIVNYEPGKPSTAILNIEGINPQTGEKDSVFYRDFQGSPECLAEQLMKDGWK